MATSNSPAPLDRPVQRGGMTSNSPAPLYRPIIHTDTSNSPAPLLIRIVGGGLLQLEEALLLR